MPLVKGSSVGDYQLERLLDQGSMGALWLAHLRKGRAQLEVAIKFLILARPDLIERFDAEIETLSRLKGPQLVQILGWGSYEGSPYLVMERLHGSNLATLLEGGRIEDVAVAVDYTVQAAAGIAQAHHGQIVHRDLKPANLFYDENAGTVKVLDFGVAGAAPSVRQPLTHDGVYIGTPNYSAPEQFEDAKRVTAAADIWALGTILYELLSGQMAFVGSMPAIVTKVRETEPIPLATLRPGLPGPLLACVERCLKKAPQQRFASAEELIEQLAPLGTSASQHVLSQVRRRLRARQGEADTQLQPTPEPPPREPTLRLEPEPVKRDPGSLTPTARTEPPAKARTDRTFYSQLDLIRALLKKRTAPSGERRSIVFMLGAGFSLPNGKNKGVPSTGGIVKLIRKELEEREMDPRERQRELRAFDDAVSGSGNAYQAAFDYLATSGQDTVNMVIRTAVLDCYERPVKLPPGSREQAAFCDKLEADNSKWDMPLGVRQLGRLIALALANPGLEHFAGPHLTTNFDPLLSIAIAQHHGEADPIAIDVDYKIPAAKPGRCRIVHLHGRWNEGDTLHNDLKERRPKLTASLTRLLRESTLVVLGYGGWDDVFMDALRRVAAEESAELDILWGFYDNRATVLKNQPDFVDQLAETCGRRIAFFERVDTNEFFKELARETVETPSTPPVAERDWFAFAAALVVAVTLAILGFVVFGPISAATTKPIPEKRDAGAEGGASAHKDDSTQLTVGGSTTAGTGGTSVLSSGGSGGGGGAGAGAGGAAHHRPTGVGGSTGKPQHGSGGTGTQPQGSGGATATPPAPGLPTCDACAGDKCKGQVGANLSTCKSNFCLKGKTCE